MRKAWISLVSVSAVSLSLIGSVGNAQNEPGVSSREILLGATYPQTGAASINYASYYSGANAYFSYLNAQGGIYGRNLRLIALDDRNSAQGAIQAANQLILRDNVFAFFSSTPSAAAHIAVNRGLALSRRGIPNLFPIVSWSGFRDSKNYPTTFILNPSAKQEARAIASFAKEEFPNLGFYSVVQDNDLGSDAISAWNSIGFATERLLSVVPNARVDEKMGGILFSNYIALRDKSSNPLIARSEAVSSINRVVGISKADWANTYAGLYLPLPNESEDEFVNFFNKIFSTYAAGQPIDAKSIEGANAAYVLAQVLSAAGPQITRQRVMEFLRSKAGSLSHAGYEPLSFGDSAEANRTSIYFAKFDGTTWNRYSPNYSTGLDSNSVTKTGSYRSKLLPNGLPIPVVSIGSVNSSITCVKGGAIKKISGVSPKCPAGYKVKK